MARRRRSPRKDFAGRRQIVRQVSHRLAGGLRKGDRAARRKLSRNGAPRPARCAAKPSGSSATLCASRRQISANSFRSRRARFIAEGEGEVQEMIDICDFAVGQSRMLYGLTIQSERPNHRLMEQWHPLGVVAVISAFNFPVAVWSWNAALAAVCGDATIWKPSEKTPLTAIAVTKIAERVCRETGADPAIFSLLIGDRRDRWAKAGGGSAHSARLRDRLDADGNRGRENGPWPARPNHPGTRRQQRAHRLPERRSRDGDAIDFLRRGRHGGSALHFHPARHRARVGR